MPPTVIDLVNILPSEGFIIQGDMPGDQAGNSVSNAGDINGDGIDDFIIGAPRGDDGGAYAGEVYVIFGKAGATRANIDLTNLAASDGFIIVGDTARDTAGYNVSGAGDVNGDGIDDLIIGAPNGDNGGYNAGEAYVIFGKAGATRANIDLTNLAASDGFIIVGDTVNDKAGHSVSSAGDINGDGIDDILIGAFAGDDGGYDSGEVYVIFGKAGATRADIDLSSLAASDGFIIVGDQAGDVVGWSVSDAGDVNGDGIDDLVVGAQLGDAGGSNSGQAYVIFGKTGATRANIDLTSLAASDGFTIVGDAANDRAGWSVSSAGDVNGDGLDDLVVSALLSADGGTYAGVAYVIFGKTGATRANIDLTSFSASDGFKIIGDAAFDQAGRSVSGAGDINGDGIDDLIVGAPYGDDGNNAAGEAYVIFGRAGATRANIDLTNLTSEEGFILQGDDVGDHAGNSVSRAGDINDDGIDDLLVGAPNSFNSGSDSGEVYVVYGKLEAGAISGTGAGDFINGTAAADAIYGLAGDDIVFGDVGDDRLFGADGSDGLFGEAGNDTLSGGAGQDKVDGGADNDIVIGGAAGDSLRGGDGDDVLDGGSGNDAMNGGTGVDVFTGGEGRDKFRFREGETGNTIATADRITDFDQAQGERISLTMMDAIVGGADDAFTFIGTAAFGNVAGQLRYELIGGNTYVMGDTDGDGASDFMIRLDGAVVLTGADFSL